MKIQTISLESLTCHLSDRTCIIQAAPYLPKISLILFDFFGDRYLFKKIVIVIEKL